MMDGAAPPPLYISGRQKTTRSGPEERCVLQALAVKRSNNSEKRELFCVRNLDIHLDGRPKIIETDFFCRSSRAMWCVILVIDQCGFLHADWSFPSNTIVNQNVWFSGFFFLSAVSVSRSSQFRVCRRSIVYALLVCVCVYSVLFRVVLCARYKTQRNISNSSPIVGYLWNRWVMTYLARHKTTNKTNMADRFSYSLSSEAQKQSNNKKKKKLKEKRGRHFGFL